MTVPALRFYTSSYSNYEPALGLAVRTSRGGPRWWPRAGLEIHTSVAKQLAPTRPMINMEREQYEPLYQGILRAADWEEVLDTLQTAAERHDDDRMVLLCFCKPDDWCHRFMLARYMEENLGTDPIEEVVKQAKARPRRSKKPPPEPEPEPETGDQKPLFKEDW